MSICAAVGGVVPYDYDTPPTAYDLTLPGIFAGRTPKAAIIYYMVGEDTDPTTNALQVGVRGGVGIVDGSGNQSSCGWAAEHAADPTITARAHSSVNAIIAPTFGGGGIEYEADAELITNGIRITPADTSSKALFFHAILISGADVQAVVMGPQSGTGPVTGIGFEPNFCYAMSVGSSGASDPANPSPVGILDVGCVLTNATHTVHAATSIVTRDNVGTTECQAYITDDDFLANMNHGASTMEWRLQHTSFASGQHNYTGDTNTDKWFPLYIRFENQDFDLITGNLPASTGAFSINSFSFDPYVVSICGAAEVTALTDGVGNLTNNYGFFIGSYYFFSEFSLSFQDIDGATQGLATTLPAINLWSFLDGLTDDNIGFRTGAITYTSGGITATANIASAAYAFWGLAFGSDTDSVTPKVALGSVYVDDIRLGPNKVDTAFLGTTEF